MHGPHTDAACLTTQDTYIRSGVLLQTETEDINLGGKRGLKRKLKGKEKKKERKTKKTNG